MVIAAGLVLIALTLLMIVYPFFTQEEGWSGDEETTINIEQEMEIEKEKIFSELNDVEMEFSTGKLSEEDYSLLKAELNKKAVGLLKADAVTREESLAEIEADIESQLQLGTEAE